MSEVPEVSSERMFEELMKKTVAQSLRAPHGPRQVVHVALVQVTQEYGGSEEGGWYYDGHWVLERAVIIVRPCVQLPRAKHEEIFIDWDDVESRISEGKDGLTTEEREELQAIACRWSLAHGWGASLDVSYRSSVCPKYIDLAIQSEFSPIENYPSEKPRYC